VKVCVYMRFTATFLVYSWGLPQNFRFIEEMKLTTGETCGTLRRGVIDIGRADTMEGDRGESGVPPVDVSSASDLVRRAISDIEASDAEESGVLLTDLLRAAWPTPKAQSQ
jgi:hypothetical protein